MPRQVWLPPGLLRRTPSFRARFRVGPASVLRVESFSSSIQRAQWACSASSSYGCCVSGGVLATRFVAMPRDWIRLSAASRSLRSRAIGRGAELNLPRRARCPGFCMGMAHIWRTRTFGRSKNCGVRCMPLSHSGPVERSVVASHWVAPPHGGSPLVPDPVALRWPVPSLRFKSPDFVCQWMAFEPSETKPPARVFSTGPVLKNAGPNHKEVRP